MCLFSSPIMDQSSSGAISTTSGSVIVQQLSTTTSNPSDAEVSLAGIAIPESTSRTSHPPAGNLPTTQPSPSTAATTLSPPGKVFGRNYNGTMVVTSTPSNEAELQLYRVLQRASLLIYYDTLLEMGGDDVQQLCDAGEEEFLEIMALVGMASKPLHVRRLQKALQEWVTNPSAFQTPLSNTPDLPRAMYSPEHAQGSSRSPFGSSIHSSIYPTSAISSSSTSSLIAPNTGGGNLSLSSIASGLGGQIGTLSSTSSSTGGMGAGVQLTPSLTEPQIHRITQAAERISQRPQMAQLAPRSQSSKKRSSKELEAVMGMNESDPRRMDEIRKYSAIYGRFDCKRRPEKPLTLHEVCVNEAAAQICRFVPALLTRRDELFTLARQVVRASGFGHSAGIARFAMSQHMPRDEDLDAPATTKKARLSSGGGSDGNLDASKEISENKEKILSMYQRMGKSFDLADSAKFSYSPYSRPEFDDDSQFSFSNSNSPPLHGSNNGGDMDSEPLNVSNDNNKHDDSKEQPSSPDSHSDGPIGIQIISASGGHIIAVANPALALSPALGDTMSVKREREVISPDIR
ncbi:NGFI-A-binding protein homolog isoform X2 [Lutzomyia longipalpis]|uniref:NGFI-A-binding protein homolog isoform X2 n=1 Tax=Lutzomyia longipalpis TaxID=7200 RepID=UPI00248342C1|nr:NGFI-A-binding protein homolog isoform X2 [Lutzomyia longipalpis]